MRFDDMLSTVLARPADKPAARIAIWCQLLDLLAQRRTGDDPAVAREALARLAAMRADVPVTVRAQTARGLAGRPVPAALVAVLAADVPQVAGALLRHTRLADGDWLAILPRLSPTGRGFLRHRGDLSEAVRGALAGFGTADFAIEAGMAPTAASERAATAFAPVDPPAVPSSSPIPAEPFEPGQGEGQIRAIISRIARYRETHGVPAPIAAPTSSSETRESFRFETGTDGVIRWVDGVPRGPIVGETIAIAAVGRYGVDAQAPGAFRRRAPFRDARLTVAGIGPAAGAWRIAGVPVFAAGDGRFLGYRGTARRPQSGERAEADDPAGEGGLYGGGLQADSLRQLVHELRTPLNAIGGFAEMIRRQMRGPAATPYRERAERIAQEAARLLTAVDDLDVAARLDTQRLDLRRVEIDTAGLLQGLAADHRAAAVVAEATIELVLAPDLVAIHGDPGAVRRMVARLLASALSLAEAGETVRVEAVRRGGAMTIAVSRPARLAGVDEARLTDPGFDADGEGPDAPLLGLGFSLRLVRNLAAAGCGSLAIEADRFLLRLPIAEGVRDAGSNG